MTLQIFLLLAFQAIYGYVYHQMALLIAMFMGGIALGCGLGLHRLRCGAAHPRMGTLAANQALLALAGPALILLAGWLAPVTSTVATWTAAQIVFPLLAIVCGALGGHQFPVASDVYLRDKKPGTGVGTLYAVDLLGGCAGALLVSTYLIPVFGFWRTAWLSAAVALTPALPAARAALPHRDAHRRPLP
jgi:spermidine synthase